MLRVSLLQVNNELNFSSLKLDLKVTHQKSFDLFVLKASVNQFLLVFLAKIFK